ncbi:hypothetical protein ACFFX0_07090 [Citricoccus parietis]|uniref:Uncharacterized protein n=1 Tax=Citricoccus parietis TaxID=592307 RepID=A0ABV5FWA0_9MICC
MAGSSPLRTSARACAMETWSSSATSVRVRKRGMGPPGRERASVTSILPRSPSVQGLSTAASLCTRFTPCCPHPDMGGAGLG